MSRISFLLLFLLLGGVVIRYLTLANSHKSFVDGDFIRLETRLLRTPKEENNLQKFILTPENFEELHITTGKYPEFKYGEKLRVSGKVKRVINKSGEEFFILSFPQIQKTDDRDFIFSAVRFIRERVTTAFSSFLPPTFASLLLGIVFGVKEGLSLTFEKNLQTTGVFHVIAASGMNVSMLSGFLIAVTGRFLRRQIAILICILGIIFYTFLAGLEPSIVRAAVMATIAFTAFLLGRTATALWSLLLTALVMLLVEPLLLFDIGFQLSFAATLGILVIKPLLKLEKRAETSFESKSPEIWQNNPTLALFSEDLGSTLSAQLATIPIMLFYFHQYGVFSVPVNALVLWTIPPLMMIGSICAAIALLSSFLAGLLSYLALPFLWFFETVVTHASSLNPVIIMKDFSLFFVFGYYFLLLSIVLAVYKKRSAEER